MLSRKMSSFHERFFLPSFTEFFFLMLSSVEFYGVRTISEAMVRPVLLFLHFWGPLKIDR